MSTKCCLILCSCESFGFFKISSNCRHYVTRSSEQSFLFFHLQKKQKKKSKAISDMGVVMVTEVSDGWRERLRPRSATTPKPSSVLGKTWPTAGLALGSGRGARGTVILRGVCRLQTLGTPCWLTLGLSECKDSFYLILSFLKPHHLTMFQLEAVWSWIPED